MDTRSTQTSAFAAAFWLLTGTLSFPLAAEPAAISPAISQEAAPVEPPGNDEFVDLTDDRLDSIDEAEDSSVLEDAWYRRLRLSGFGAFSYIDGGQDSLRPIAGFEVKEATLFLEAEAWENIFFFLEYQTNQLGYDNFDPRTAEVHLHFRNVLRKYGEGLLGIKVGRFDIPFGEEYLQQDSSDNPLISLSAAYPYGWDEGVLLYGSYRGLDWIVAVTDGSDQRSKDDHSGKALNLKLSGEPLPWLYLSASAMRTGKAGKSAIEFGGSHFEPVGRSGPSTLPTSPSALVEGELFEVDAKASFGISRSKGYVSVAYGVADSDDPVDAFDRDFRWLIVEPYLQIAPKLYTVARYCEIGTYDGNLGFHFDGKPFAGGNRTFGFDTERLTRFSIGAGFHFTPTVTFKIEVGRDRFDLIEASALSSRSEDRDLLGLELVVAF